MWLVLLWPAAVVVGEAVAGVTLRLRRVADKTVRDFVQLMAVVLVSKLYCLFNKL